MKDDMKAKAKREALGKFKREMGKMGSMGITDHLKAMNDAPMKATVIAEDEEGLKEGLEKAEEIVEKKMDMEEDHESDIDTMDADALREYIKERM